MASLADALLGNSPGPIPLASLRTAQDARNIPLASILGIPSADATPAASMQTMMGGNQGVGPADAYQSTSGAVGDWIADQRAQSAAQGLWNDQTGLPTSAGVQNALTSIALGTNSAGGGIRAYHGSPHDFEAFDASKIGTGEGAQAYGHGLYFAGNEGVARSYRDALAKPNTPEQVAQQYLSAFNGDRDLTLAKMGDHVQGGFGLSAEEAANLRAGYGLLKSGVPISAATPGHMYEVNIAANPDHFLDWDKPLSEQHPVVQTAVQNIADNSVGLTARMMAAEKSGVPVTGRDVMASMATGADYGSQAIAQTLKNAGIPGIRYLDGGSRASGEGTSNHVVFDPATIEILRKYGLAGLMAGGGAAAGAQSQ